MTDLGRKITSRLNSLVHRLRSGYFGLSVSFGSGGSTEDSGIIEVALSKGSLTDAQCRPALRLLTKGSQHYSVEQHAMRYPRRAPISSAGLLRRLDGQRWQLQTFVSCTGYCRLVTSIGVTHDARGGIVPQDALDAPRRLGCTVANDDYAGVLRITHPDTAAMMDRNPGRAARAVQQGSGMASPTPRRSRPWVSLRLVQRPVSSPYRGGIQEEA